MLKNYLIFIVLLVFSGCTTIPYDDHVYTYDSPEPERIGVYHKVHKGETIWRIAKAYQIPMNDIINANNIPNVAKIEKNQLIFIPGATEIKTIYLDKSEDKHDFIWPIKGKVTNFFHSHKDGQLNKGIDISCREGDEVRAARTGRVVFADTLPGYGNMIILDHGDGFMTVYANNALMEVKLGDMVVKNQVIGKIGGQKQLAFLHFQVRKNAIEDNPLYYLP
ncbi:MAG: peptidoglycan DD-metalloendopeptidase family protein [Candidatus Omnitrophica bacterium]|nr:peptidoglycan DD-metalloendopeptidase family protein [Candidatus Omnitrophota bacterium]